jgi:hypothetical protein
MYILNPNNVYADFLVLGFLHGVGKLADDVSETAVGPIFSAQESEH